MTTSFAIHVWGNERCIFIDLSDYEIRRFPRAEYLDTLENEVAYHVNRLLWATGFETFINDTELDIKLD